MTGDLDHRDDERMQEDDEVFVIEGLLEEEEDIQLEEAAAPASQAPGVAAARTEDSSRAAPALGAGDEEDGDRAPDAAYGGDEESVEFDDGEHLVAGAEASAQPSGVFELDLEGEGELCPSGETVFLRGTAEDSGEDDRLADVPELEELPGLAAREREADEAQSTGATPVDELEVEDDLSEQLFPAGETLFLSAAESEGGSEEVPEEPAAETLEGLDPLLPGGAPAAGRPPAPEEFADMEVDEVGAPPPAPDLFTALGGGEDAADQVELELDAAEDPYPAGESGFFQAVRPVGGHPAEPEGLDAEAAGEDDDWAPIREEPLEEDAGLLRADEGAGDQETWEDEAWQDAEAPEWDPEAAEPVGAFTGEGGFETRRRSWFSWRLAAGAAAVVILGVGGTIAFVKPEWMGMKVEPVLVARTEIARPQVKLELPPPVAEFSETRPAADPQAGTAIDPGAVTQVEPEPEPRPVPDPEPSASPTPAPRVAIPLDPSEAPGDVRPRPVAPSPGPVADPSVEVPAELSGLLAAGDDLLIGPYQGAPELPERSVPAVAKDVVAGSQAFAQLRNGNFFVGTIKTLDAAYVTMRLERGEVTLPFSEVSVLTALSSEEYRNLQKAQSGFVRLRNDNRIVGNVLDPKNGKDIVVIGRKQRVTIPRSAIEEIGSRAPGGVRAGSDPTEDAWIRSIVERRLQQQNQVKKLQRRVQRELGRGR